MASASDKAPDAFRTIGELSEELGVAQHVLRYWETKFPQLRPLQRAGNRRYYRPADVALARRIHRLLHDEGYTVKGVQKLLRAKGGDEEMVLNRPVEMAASPPEPAVEQGAEPIRAGVDMGRLVEIRDRLASAIAS